MAILEQQSNHPVHIDYPLVDECRDLLNPPID